MGFIERVFLILAASTLVLSDNANIQTECQKGSITITWTVDKALASRPSRLLLGNCFPSKFSRTANGGGKAVFHYRLNDCGFRQMRTEKQVIYRNVLAFRPLTEPHHPSTNYPIECVFDRPEWMRPYVKPTFGALKGHGRLVFHMGLLNDDLSGPALSNIVTLGSFIYIWAAVEQQRHQPLMLFMEECVASNTMALAPDSQIYPVVTNKGCLVDGKSGYSRFLPRSYSSSLLLQLQVFKFVLGSEVYLHCNLVVWDPDDLNEEKKACNFNRDVGEWELLDDPSQNDLCYCCDHSCRKRKQSFLSEPKELAQNYVLGPLFLTSSTRTKGQ